MLVVFSIIVARRDVSPHSSMSTPNYPASVDEGDVMTDKITLTAKSYYERQGETRCEMSVSAESTVDEILRVYEAQLMFLGFGDIELTFRYLTTDRECV